MFRDKYRADNEKIVPDEALLKYLSVRMSDVTSVENKVVTPTSHRHKILRPLVALAACFALVFSTGGLYVIFDRTKKQPVVSAEKITKAKTGVTYAELYELVKSMEPKNESGGIFDGFFGNGAQREESVDLAEEAFPPTAAGAGKPNTAPTNKSSSSSTDYSKTNTQVQGVDEADIVKTDGKYIYTLSNGRLTIVRVQGAQMQTVSSVDCTTYSDTDDKSQPIEMYINGNRLVMIKNVYNTENNNKTDAVGAREIYAYTTDMAMYNGSTSAAVYDITDRSKPKLLVEPGQSGNYLSSRMVGNTLYLISNHTIYAAAEKDKPETYLPMLYDGVERKAIAAEDITISAQPQGRQYVVVAAVDINNPAERLSSKTVFGCGSQLYASTENLLIASYAQNKTQEDAAEKDDTLTTVSSKPTVAEKTESSDKSTSVTYTTMTNLLRFSLNDGKIELAATGSVPGSLLNQFSMDEYKDYFRMVTTTNEYTETRSGSGDNGVASFQAGGTANALYTLNQKLEIVGRIEDVARGEQVYSVRFSGDIGYFVTFRQVDPLFSVDLTNPAKPKILSALKIPGFSDYLHPYSDGLLFGLGHDADDYGRVGGLKLSMFDVSDPTDVSEKHKLILSEQWSEASYNHKAIVISPERRLIAFPSDNKYIIFSYSDKTGFAKAGDFYVEEISYNLRGLYIGNVFYVCSGNAISAYSMNGYMKLGMIRF